MMGALALTFGACSSEDDVVTPQLTGESVKTTFTFNIPNSKMGTRMTAGEAGETEVTDFSGIESIVLLPFAKSGDVAGTDVLALSPISLAAITEWTSNGNANNFNGKVYNDVTVPVGVNHFLFYGKRTGSNGEGELTATLPTAAGTAAIQAAAKFDLVPVTDKTVATLGANAATGKAVLDALNGVSSAFATAITTAEGTTKSILTDLCAAFETNLAGSAASVNALLADLKATLTTIPGTNAIQTACAAFTDTFPAGLNLPDGAVGVKCTDHVWAFAATNVNGLGQPELNTYVKPAELWYTVNTPIHVDPEKQEPNYDSKAEWADVVALYDAGTAVTSATRAIVLDDEIQFAVAQLKSRVIVDAGTGTAPTLKANDGVPGGTTPTLVDVVAASAAQFDVTAILVGGQKNLDWAFLPIGTSEFVVYDAVQTGSNVTAKSGTATDWNYTLVGETKATEVKVLVELVNNLKDADNNPIEFYGYNDQLIPAGAKFYLLGTLKVSEANTKNIDVVFKQDYTTIVTFKIGATSLTNAYNTIPDLRTPELELGLGVDLEWRAGLEFNGVVLGE